MTHPLSTLGLAALAALLPAPLRASLPVALAAPAPLAGPGIPLWQQMGSLGLQDPEDADAGVPTPLDNLMRLAARELGPEPEPEWTLPAGFLDAYPGSGCRGQDDSELDKLVTLYRQMEPAVPLTDLEAAAVSQSLSETWRVEEFLGTAQARIRDLDDYVCKVHKAWSASGAPDRNRVLFDRLYAAKGLRQALTVALRDAQGIVQACWKRLGKDPKRWAEPDETGGRLEWPDGVPDPVRVDLLRAAAEQMEAARKRFDAQVLPLLKELKRLNAAPVRREAEERIEAAPGPKAEPGTKRKARK